MYMRRAALALLALSYSLGPATWAQGQQSPNDAGRKVLRKVQPEYPSDARRMNLGGTVKLFAMVAPNGSVKKVGRRRQPAPGSCRGIGRGAMEI